MISNTCVSMYCWCGRYVQALTLSIIKHNSLLIPVTHTHTLCLIAYNTFSIANHDNDTDSPIAMVYGRLTYHFIAHNSVFYLTAVKAVCMHRSYCELCLPCLRLTDSCLSSSYVALFLTIVHFVLSFIMMYRFVYILPAKNIPAYTSFRNGGLVQYTVNVCFLLGKYKYVI